MSQLESVTIHSEKGVEAGRSSRESFSAMQLRPDSHDRLAELERENSRLNRLVAELLIKNQQLREAD